MRFLIGAAMTLSSAAAAAEVSFEAFVAEFPEAKPPLTIGVADGAPPGARDLSRRSVADWVLPDAAHAKRGSEALREVWSDSELRSHVLGPAWELNRFAAAWRVRLGGHTVLGLMANMTVTRVKDGEPVIDPLIDGTMLIALVFGPNGELVGESLLAYHLSQHSFHDRADATIAADGVITRVTAVQRPLTGFALLEPGDERPPYVTVRTVEKAKLSAAGRYEWAPETHLEPTGRFVDRKTGEKLDLVYDSDRQALPQPDAGRPPKVLEVHYRSPKSKSFLKLSVSPGPGGRTFTVRFPSSPKPYVLTFDERLAGLSCRNPDGSLQSFVRE